MLSWPSSLPFDEFRGHNIGFQGVVVDVIVVFVVVVTVRVGMGEKVVVVEERESSGVRYHHGGCEGVG